jgi:hypothetical protein
MATRQQLIVWIPTILVCLLTVCYVEWRMRRAAEITPVREPAGVRSQETNARGSNDHQRALVLAAAANTRAERAEQAAEDLKERFARQEESDDTASEPMDSAENDDPELQLAQREAFLNELDERFKAEPVDRAWRLEKESALQRTAEVMRSSGVSLASAQCASSMCKVSLAHASHRRPPRTALIDFLRAVHAEGSPLTRFAFNFKYEDGATILYGTTDTAGKEATRAD